MYKSLLDALLGKKIAGFVSKVTQPKQPNEGTAVPDEVPYGPKPSSAEDWDDKLLGKVEEGLNLVWRKIFGGTERILLGKVPEIINKGTLSPGNYLLYKSQEARAAILEYPSEGIMRTGAILARPKDAPQMQFWSACPLMPGRANQLLVSHSYTWFNGVEGIVAARLGEDMPGPPLTFYAPYYFRDHGRFVPGARLCVELSALALTIDKVGGRNNAKPLIPAGTVGLAPTGQATEWKFRCKITGVRQTSLLGIKIMQLETCWLGPKDSEINGFLYVPYPVLGRFKPQTGLEIEGFMWLTGSILAPEAPALKKSDTD